ncbi:hypothetical protein ZIOFF_025367 [Zingiber officinale]|uniref:Uncharacterized protein n=1 Tax=Zingiber officinale TaxID=94328 RepID=A0A8J5HAT6_ZINOF|nr:hypothetical protein ZIOFF_025367 [Zingiber officinale]
MLEFFYSKVESDALKCQKKMDLVKTKLYKLFDQYSNTNNTSSSQPQSSTTHTLSQSVGGVKGKNKRMFDKMMAYESQTITSAGKSQLNLYLEEPKLEFAYYQDLDILEHGKNQKHRYPTLALMAYKDNEDNANIKTTFSKQESNTLEEDINEEKGGEGRSEEIDVDDYVDLLIADLLWSVDYGQWTCGLWLCIVDLLIVVVCGPADCGCGVVVLTCCKCNVVV